MYVADLALTDYRSYEQAVVSFPPGATVLVGSNGQGKTNLVESINYLATLPPIELAPIRPWLGVTQAVKISPTPPSFAQN